MVVNDKEDEKKLKKKLHWNLVGDGEEKEAMLRGGATSGGMGWGSRQQGGQ